MLDIEDTDEPVFTICDGIYADIKTLMSQCLLSAMESVLDIKTPMSSVFTICDGICADIEDTDEPSVYYLRWNLC